MDNPVSTYARFQRRGESCGRNSAERTMWPDGVVFHPPILDNNARLCERRPLHSTLSDWRDPLVLRIVAIVAIVALLISLGGYPTG